MQEILNSLQLGEMGTTGLLSGAALVAVLFPFWSGLRICLQAMAATRRLKAKELRVNGSSASTRGVEPLALTLVRVIRKSLWESDRESYPTEFVVDASKQYAMNEYEDLYGRPISMYANILPPIGFIGTTGGLLILFLSMHSSNSSLELGALALALTSSIFALMAFAALEAMKIRLYARLLKNLRHAIDAVRSAAAEEGRAGLQREAKAAS